MKLLVNVSDDIPCTFIIYKTDLACPFSKAASVFHHGLVQKSWPEELNSDQHKRFGSCSMNSPERNKILNDEGL